MVAALGALPRLSACSVPAALAGLRSAFLIARVLCLVPLFYRAGEPSPAGRPFAKWEDYSRDISTARKANLSSVREEAKEIDRYRRRSYFPVHVALGADIYGNKCAHNVPLGSSPVAKQYDSGKMLRGDKVKHTRTNAEPAVGYTMPLLASQKYGWPDKANAPQEPLFMRDGEHDHRRVQNPITAFSERQHPIGAGFRAGTAGRTGRQIMWRSSLRNH